MWEAEITHLRLGNVRGIVTSSALAALAGKEVPYEQQVAFDTVCFLEQT
jgi:hypothetical protein